MPANTYGYQPIFDGGAPRVITGYAMEAVSGAWFLGASGPAGIVSSGTDSFVTSDITLYHTKGSGNFVGVALHNAGSGQPISVATRGTFLVEVSGTIVLAGTQLQCNNADEVCGSLVGDEPDGGWDIGRTWTTGSDGNFVVFDVQG